MTERERIDFVIERDGIESAIKFAEQGLALYVEEALRRSPALKESITEWRKFLEEHGKQVKWVVVHPNVHK